MPNTVIEIPIDLFPPQDEFVYSDAGYALYMGPRGEGKTAAGAIKLLRYHTEHPGARTIVVSASNDQLLQGVMPAIQKFFPPAYIKRRYWSPHPRLVLVDGGESLFYTADDPEKFRSLECHAFWADEAAQIRERSFLQLQACRRLPEFPNQAWLTTTPKGYQNWVTDRFITHPLPGYTIFYVTPGANRHVSEKFRSELKESYGEGTLFYRQELLGQIVGYEGMLFPNFDPDKHIKRHPGTLRILAAGVDWGYHNPWAVIVGGHDSDGRLWIVDEFVKSGITLDDFAAQCLRMKQRWGAYAFFCDGSEPANVHYLRKKGIPAWQMVRRGSDWWWRGVRHLDSLMVPRPDGTFGFYMAPHCTALKNSLLSVHFPERRSEDQPKSDRPVKQNDDPTDALRYLNMGITEHPIGSRPSVKFGNFERRSERLTGVVSRRRQNIERALAGRESG